MVSNLVAGWIFMNILELLSGWLIVPSATLYQQPQRSSTFVVVVVCRCGNLLFQKVNSAPAVWTYGPIATEALNALYPIQLCFAFKASFSFLLLSHFCFPSWIRASLLSVNESIMTWFLLIGGSNTKGAVVSFLQATACCPMMPVDPAPLSSWLRR